MRTKVMVLVLALLGCATWLGLAKPAWADHGPSHGQGRLGGGGGGSIIMGRLRTIGFEIGLNAVTTQVETKKLEGFTLDPDQVFIDTAVSRSGASSLHCSKVVSGETVCTITLDTTYVRLWQRAYFKFDEFPTDSPDPDIRIMNFETAAGLSVPARVHITTDGRLRLFNRVSAQIGVDSDPLSVGTWYRIELFCERGTTPSDGKLELRLDGKTVASSDATDTGSSNLQIATLGWIFPVNTGAQGLFHADDWAINDDSGTDQNSWPGPGQIVLLKPISDAQVGTWTGGAGGTTNLFDAVNNTPPIGTASETNLTQIESADSSGDNPTDEYRANLTTYADAGIDASDDIILCQAVLDHGEDVATGTKTGSFLILSNPAQGTADTFTFGDDEGALGTWSVNWKAKWGTAQYNPVVTLTTSPVLRIRKTDTTTRVGSVDFMGVMVEYRDNVPVMQPTMGLFSPIFTE